MKVATLIAVLMFASQGAAEDYDYSYDYSYDAIEMPQLQPQDNTYGPGVGSDPYGRPSVWVEQHSGTRIQPGLRVQPDAYGLGVGMDAYGRPVKQVPLFGH